MGMPTASRVAHPASHMAETTRVGVVPAVLTGPVRSQTQRGEHKQQGRDAERKQKDQVMPL
jgi:hypothetical protein